MVVKSKDAEHQCVLRDSTGACGAAGNRRVGTDSMHRVPRNVQQQLWNARTRFPVAGTGDRIVNAISPRCTA